MGVSVKEDNRQGNGTIHIIILIDNCNAIYTESDSGCHTV